VAQQSTTKSAKNTRKHPGVGAGPAGGGRGARVLLWPGRTLDKVSLIYGRTESGLPHCIATLPPLCHTVVRTGCLLPPCLHMPEHFETQEALVPRVRNRECILPPRAAATALRHHRAEGSHVTRWHRRRHPHCPGGSTEQRVAV
jgi:hypothetical protein